MNSEDVQIALSNESVDDAIRAIDGLADILTFELWNDAPGLRVCGCIFDGIEYPGNDDGRIAGRIMGDVGTDIREIRLSTPGPVDSPHERRFSLTFSWGTTSPASDC